MAKRVKVKPIQECMFVDLTKPILDVLRPIKKKRRK